MASFLGKLGNVLEDTASAAVPAGLTFLMTQNPLAALSAGAKGFQANEQGERARKLNRRQKKAIEEAQEANSLSQGRANLINLLSPGSGARPNLQTDINVKAPKAGFLETLAGGVGTGVDAIQAFKAAEALRKSMERKATVENAQIEQIRGADAAAREGMEEVVSTGGPQRSTFTLPETVSTAKAPEAPTPLGFLSGGAAERRAEREQDLKLAANQTALQVANAKANAEMLGQMRLASLVATNPASFHDLGEKKGDAMLGLLMAGDEGAEIIRQVSGRKLTGTQESKLQEGMSALRTVRELDEIYAKLEQSGDTGPLGSINLPAGEAAALARRAEQLLAILPSQLRNANETGVMNDRDEARYITQIPDLSAFDQTSERSAFNLMKSALERDYKKFATGLSSTGVQLGEFSGGDDSIREELIEEILRQVRP